MNLFYPEVAQRAKHRCEYCHAPEATFNFPFEVEHLVPEVSGGDDTIDHLAPACRSCNAFRSARQTGVDPERQTLVSLFHPRRDVWDEHFTVDIETLVIKGKTSIGRATIVALQMNSPAQLVARRQWRRLDLFP